ncbi:MAG: hypothetical protein FWC26_10165 [Fibromonadales bacterium]|nr:hypothetical protein [Fibromonadales bacterium]
MKIFLPLLALLLPTLLFAQTPWDGTANTAWYTGKESASAYTITTAEQLAGLAQLVKSGTSFQDKTITLGANIVLNDTTLNGSWQNWANSPPTNEWIPIGIFEGTYDKVFQGTFDGADYIVSGMYINTGSGSQGLFGASIGTIRNLGVNAFYISGGGTIGGLVGRHFGGGTIVNSYTSGNVKGGSNVGGLVGVNGGTYNSSRKDGTIINSYATGNVEGNNDVGGLVGNNGGGSKGTITNSYASGNVDGKGVVGGLVGTIGYDSFISNSYATGNVEGSGDDIGGLAGNNGGTIDNSYATGNVEGNNYVGGLVGTSRDGTITNSYAIGNVFGNTNVGGVAGSGGIIANSYAIGNVFGNTNVGGLVGGYHTSNCKINNCYATGKVDGNANVGGLVGFDYYNYNFCIYTNSYYNSETTLQSDTGRGTPKTTAEMQNRNTYIDWDFENIWGMLNSFNDGNPHLQWQTPLGYANIEQIPNPVVYTGSKFTPKPTVIHNGVELKENEDFYYEYGENTNAGTGWVAVIGKTATYFGIREIYFTINKAPGYGEVGMASWYEGEKPPMPVAIFTVNDSATFRYWDKAEGENYAQTTRPANPGTYIVEATFLENGNYKKYITTAEFKIWQVANIQLAWTPACGFEFIYNGETQSPEPSAAGYKQSDFILAGAGTNAESYAVTAKFADSTMNRSVNLQNTACPYTIAKKPVTVTWQKAPEYIYNKTTQGPTATLSDASVEFRRANIFSGAGEYTAANNLAPYIQLIGPNAGNYELANYTTDYEILKKDLTPKFETTLPDFAYKNDTLRVPSEVFQDTAALQQILDSIVAYEGFATDTVKKETDDATVLKGKAKVKIKYDDQDGNSQGNKSFLAKRVETTQKATATIITDDVSADNYKPLDRSITIVGMEDDEGGYAMFCKREEKCIALSEEICWFLSGEVVSKCDEVLILNSPLSTLNSQLPKYYTLKGILLGTQKPTAPGVYIEARGVKAKKIMVR